VNGTSILREQLEWTHDLLEQAVADLPAEQWHHRGEGATVQSMATIYVHTVLAEDWLIHAFLCQEPTLFERDGWAAKLGYEAALPPTHDQIAQQVRDRDLAATRAYAQQVYAASDCYLASLADADLDRTVTFGPMTDLPVGKFLGNIVAHHTAHHGGEICALKGNLGGKGLPF
jgi:hypothetical protein